MRQKDTGRATTRAHSPHPLPARPYDTLIPLLCVEEEAGNWWSGQRNVGYRVPIVALLAVGE
jgi:hypothetical protein